MFSDRVILEFQAANSLARLSVIPEQANSLTPKEEVLWVQVSADSYMISYVTVYRKDNTKRSIVYFLA